MASVILPLLFAALGIGGIYYVATHSPKLSPPQLDAFRAGPAGAHKLMPDTWYRVTCLTTQDVIDRTRENAPEGASQVTLQNNFKGALERVGFTATKLALQDPLNPLGWVFISQWHHPAQDAIPALDGLSITNLQSVEAPPDLDNRPESPSTLDAGIPYDEAHAVAYALAKDNDPKHLRNFAKTLRPDYPISAALLDAKATLVETMSKGGAAKISGRRISLDANSVLHRRASVSGVNLSKLPLPAYVTRPTATLAAATRGLGSRVARTWKAFDGYTNILGGQIPGPTIWMAETGAKTLVDIARRPAGSPNPERVSRETAPFLKSLKSSSPLLARIPGIGLGIDTALEAGAALSLGEPLSESLFGTVAADGVNAKVFRAAMNAGAIMAPNEVLRAQRAGLPNDELRAIYDAGLAIGRAKSLQEAGFQGLYTLIKGNTLTEKANHFAASARKANVTGREIKDLLTEDLIRETSKVGKDPLDQELRPLLAAMVQNERLQKMSAAQLSKAARVSEASAWAALACVKRLPGGIGLLDPNLVRKVLPSPPRDVSASALALVAIMKRPGQEWPGLEQPATTGGCDCNPPKEDCDCADTEIGGCDFYDAPCWAREAAKVAAAVAEAALHPANTAEGAWNIVSHPGRSLSDFADATITLIHVVPGMDEAGELLKKFARTALGQIFLQAMTSMQYAYLAPVLGPQGASIAFATPGVAKKEKFFNSWVAELARRTEATLSWFMANGLAEKVLGAFSGTMAENAKTLEDAMKLAPFQEFWAKLQGDADRAGDGLKKIIGETVSDLPDRVQRDVSGALDEAKGVLEQYAGKYATYPAEGNGINYEALGLKGKINFDALGAKTQSRPDMTAAAFDLWTGSNYLGSREWDPATGRDLKLVRMARIRKAMFQSVQQVTAQQARARGTPEAQRAAAAAAAIAKTKFSSVRRDSSASVPTLSQREMQAAQTRAKLAQSRFSDVKKAAALGDPKAKAAQVQLLRANQILERRKWIEHYKKVERAEHEARPVTSGLRTNTYPQKALG